MTPPVTRGVSLLLAFDTSAAACSVALLALDPPEGGARLVAHRSLASAGAQTRLLLPACEDVLAEVGATPGDLSGLVVGIGPGTFTGVRIGVASARAAALGLRVPVVGVSGLAALAAAALEDGRDAGPSGEADPPEAVVPVVDARRGQVFGCVYERDVAADPGGSCAVWRRRGSVFAAAPADVKGAVLSQARTGETGRLLFVGRTDLLPADLLSTPGVRALSRDVDAAFLVRGQQRLEGEEEGIESGGVEGRRLLSWLNTVVGQVWPADAASPGDLGTPEAVRPLYVRAPDADLHITKMKDPWAS